MPTSRRHHHAGAGVGAANVGAGAGATAKAKESADQMHERRRYRRAQNMYGSSSSATYDKTGSSSSSSRSLVGACTAGGLPLPEKVRDRIEIEANSASVQRLRNGCVVPAVGCVKDSVGFVRREMLNKNGRTDGTGSYNDPSAGASGPGSRGSSRERLQMQRGSSSPGKRRYSQSTARSHSRSDGTHARGRRDSPSNSLSANSRSLLSDDDDDDDDDEDTYGTTGSASVTSGTESPSTRSDGGAPGPIKAGLSLSTPVRRGRAAAASNDNRHIPHRGEGGGEEDGRYLDADVNASIERREREERLKGERNWMMTTTPSPRGVASPDAKMKGKSAAAVGFSGIQFASYQDEDDDSAGSGQEEHVVGSGGADGGEAISLNDNRRGDGYAYDDKINSMLDNDNDVQNVTTSSGTADADDENVLDKSDDDMLDLRLSLFQGDKVGRSIMSSGSDPSTNADGQSSGHADITNNMVPVSQLKRTVGELALQDDVIDKLQVELAEVRSDRDGLQQEVTLLRKQLDSSARKDKAKLLQQEQIERLMSEMERLRSDVAEKDDEIQRHESYRQRQNQLHDRNITRQKRQEEEIRRLEEALALARSANANCTASLDGRGLFNGDADVIGGEDDGNGSVLTVYTYPQRKQTEMAKSSTSRSHANPSTTENIVENLQYRTEVVDLKLQISEYESKLRRALEELVDAKNDLKFERDGREMAEGELSEAKESEKKALAKCQGKDLPSISFESLERSNGSQSFPVDVDDVDTIHDDFEEVLNRKDEEIRSLRAELDRNSALLDVAEDGLKEAKSQIESLQDENEELRLTTTLIEREIDISVDQDAFLRSEIDALQQILAETEKEVNEAAVNSTTTPLTSSPRVEELEGELSTLKLQMAKAQEILLGAKEKHESEWAANEKIVRALQEENEMMKRQVSNADKSTTDSSLSVMNVSLKAQVVSLKSRLADQGQQLTELEMKLSEKTELESTLREAIAVLKRQNALLRRHGDDVDDLRRADGADDILEDELSDLEEFLASVEAHGIDGTTTADEVDEIKRELEGRLYKSEMARLDAEAELATAHEDLKREQADVRKARQEYAQSNVAKLDLEKRLTKNVEATELLRSEFANIRQQLHRAGIKIESLPQNQKQQNGKRVTWSMSEQTEAENLLKRSEKVTAGFADEITELKRLLGRVLEQGKKERGADSKELNKISNDKLLQASSDLRSLIRIRNDMETLSESIQQNCQAVLRIHQANNELREGKYVAPDDEIIDELCRS